MKSKSLPEIEEELSRILFVHFQGKNRPSVVDSLEAQGELIQLINSLIAAHEKEVLERIADYFVYDSYNDEIQTYIAYELEKLASLESKDE